ncbi:MAG: hypothetical protein ON057_000253 [Glomeribacter sp. 1016415]|nr:hypothetical protein [Glomeribacter sp. 1016415]
MLKVTTASVHSACECACFSTSQDGNLRARSLSAFWLHTAAVGYIRVCKRRSDRFPILANSCAIEQKLGCTLMKRVSHAALKRSSYLSNARAIRAVLFATAIEAMLVCRRCMRVLIHRLCLSSRRCTNRITARAPCTSKVRK